MAELVECVDRLTAWLEQRLGPLGGPADACWVEVRPVALLAGATVGSGPRAARSVSLVARVVPHGVLRRVAEVFELLLSATDLPAGIRPRPLSEPDVCALDFELTAALSSPRSSARRVHGPVRIVDGMLHHVPGRVLGPGETPLVGAVMRTKSGATARTSATGEFEFNAPEGTELFPIEVTYRGLHLLATCQDPPVLPLIVHCRLQEGDEW